MRRELIGSAIRIALGLVAGVAIALALHHWLQPEAGTLEITLFGTPIEFLDGRWLYLLALAPYFFVARAWSLTDVSFAQQYLQAGLRTLVLAGIALALARPVRSSSDDRVATVVLVDVSKSISDGQLRSALSYVKELDSQKPSDSKMYLITFAERPRLIRKWREIDRIARHDTGGESTDVQSAMQLAYGLYPPGFLPRIVVISDGNQTHGDMLNEAYRAKEFKVRVSWKTFPQDQVKEIRVVGLNLPDEIKVGAPFNVSAEVWSTHAEEVTLTLQQDEFLNGLEPSKTVQLTEGVNRIKFRSEAKHAGFTTYKLRLSKYKEDTVKDNNEAVMSAPIKGRPRVLYVEGGTLRDPSSASYLARWLKVENMDVDVRGPQGVPSDAKALEPYDMVVVSDVPIHFLGSSQMAALERYVRDMGGGLIAAGGEDSFGSGGYQGTTLEKILPVTFDSETDREQPSLAIALAIDRSGSMAGQKLEAAKESARATLSKLSPSDMIAVFAFDSVSIPVVQLQRAANRGRIDGDIARLSAGGGTNIYPGLRDARDALINAKARVKHAIVLSDGQAPYDGIAEICQEMQASKITVSAIGIGDADRNLMQMIADNGGGKYYFIDDLGALPALFAKETMEYKKKALIEERIFVNVAKNSQIIAGTGVSEAPALRGYVPTKVKPTADLVLTSREHGDPLLAHWRLGAGQTVAWTSDVKNRWSAEWVRWGGYGKFWAQLIRSTMRRKNNMYYDMYAQVVDGRAQISVDAVAGNDKFVNDLETTLEIIDPRDSRTKSSLPMRQTAAGRYTADFPVDRYGSFLLKATHKRDNKVVAESVGAVSLPYAEEYRLGTRINEQPLRHAATVTGGAHNAAAKDVFATYDESIVYTQDLWPWFLLFTAAIFLLDIYLKRLRVFGYRAIKFS